MLVDGLTSRAPSCRRVGNLWGRVRINGSIGRLKWNQINVNEPDGQYGLVN